MRTTGVRSGQTWADLAVEHYGTLEAVVDLAAANGEAVSDTPQAGRTIVLPEAASYPGVVLELRRRGVHPGTAQDGDTDDDSGVFTKHFTEQFK